jgi:cytochrome c peroxidase
VTAGDKHDLIEFLKSLTDEDLLRDPRWSDPWVHTTASAPAN